MSRKRHETVGVAAYRDRGYQSRPDNVVTEEPLEIRVEGEPLAVVMRTPGHDIELTAGFLVAEEIVRDSDDIGTIKHCTTADEAAAENVIDVRLAPSRAKTVEAELARRSAQRSTVTSASCGVCGKRTIESLHASSPPFGSSPRVDAREIVGLPERLRAAQELFELTGALHAAAIFDSRRELLVIREDVGRHNAVDKCVGHLLLYEQLPVSDSTLMVSGRTSFEIVQKALVARVQTVAAVSAPSSLAIALAKDSNMALAGFVRNGGFNLYVGDADDAE